MAAGKKGGLGRGLDALFADAVPVYDEAGAVKAQAKDTEKKGKAEHTAGEKSENDGVRYIKIHDIMPNLNQPRKTFQEDKIEELAASIKEHGIIQPIVVRKQENGYEIVAGERRWRAARKAELSQVPCLVRELTDEQNMLFAIIENMQREDLNPIEEAEGLQRMMQTFGMTQEQVSRSVGKSRPYIANALRLLKLPQDIIHQISEGNLSAAHGRTLAGIEDDAVKEKLCEKILKEGLSVRETEQAVNALAKPQKKKPVKKQKNPNEAKVEEELKAQEIQYKIPEQGIMIETPAAVMISDRLAEMVDFFSIGTNDLTQYTLAIDRQNEKLDDFYNPHHEAILRMIQMVVDNAHKCGKWAGICGELGADATLTEKFVRMGLDELSVAPSMVLKLRKIVREIKTEE